MSFSSDIRKFIVKTGGNADTLVREIVMEMGARLVERSPVGNPENWQRPESAPAGYVGGRFRANWQYKFGSPPEGDLPDIDKTGQVSLNRIQLGVSQAPGAGVHWIANNLPYAMSLENGHSSQAPHGMLALAVTDFQGIIRDELRRMNP